MKQFFKTYTSVHITRYQQKRILSRQTKDFTPTVTGIFYSTLHEGRVIKEFVEHLLTSLKIEFTNCLAWLFRQTRTLETPFQELMIK